MGPMKILKYLFLIVLLSPSLHAENKTAALVTEAQQEQANESPESANQKAADVYKCLAPASPRHPENEAFRNSPFCVGARAAFATIVLPLLYNISK